MFSDMLSESQKAAIADVAIAHAELEAELDRCIIELCEVSWPHGATLLDGVRVERKIDILSRLFEIEFHGQSLPTLLLTVCSSLKSLNTQRNVIIHGQWTLRSLVNCDSHKSPKRGSAQKDIDNKDVVVRTKKRGRKSPTIGAKTVRNVADLLTLNRRLLHQLFYEHFANRIVSLAGSPEVPSITSEALSKQIATKSKQAVAVTVSSRGDR